MAEALVAESLVVGHVGLNVTDLDRSIAFYSRVLGLEVLRRGDEPEGRYAYVGVNGTPALTLWQQSSGAFDERSPGLHHLAFTAPDIDAVRRSESSLRALGVRFVHDGLVRHSEGSTSAGIFFEDPDGVRLEIYAPAGATSEPAPTGAAPACGFF